MLRAGGAELRAVPGSGLGARGARGSLAGVQWPVAGGGTRGKECRLSVAPHAGCSARGPKETSAFLSIKGLCSLRKKENVGH